MSDEWLPLFRITCPFCAGLGNVTCCRCRERRSILLSDATVMEWIWDVRGCSCSTCKALREQRPALGEKVA